MDTSKLKHFAQVARRQLLDQVGARLEQVLRTDSVEIREKQKVVDELQSQINKSSKGAVIARVAYTWFNRFCALRFMDVNHYTPVGVVSPTEGFTQPEILQEAKQGVFDESLKVDRERVRGLLSGSTPSSNPQQEAYRLLLVGACNAYHDRMPFLFEEIEDYTELLMPDDLLSEKSVLQGVRDALTPEACQDVEVIGWLYQYYISERKDEVFANLKENKKIQSEDIPAATQLFTPHWIVCYLVENSLGRLWILNHPASKLVDQMEYYIPPQQEETDFLELGSPEEIKICDPACGSGHMLTYAFDLLYSIYEEQGYDPMEIPRLILESNLFGIEIDERAGDLAAFALMMKAREKDKRFFERDVEPKVCVLENVLFTDKELDRYMDAVGRDLITQDLRETLKQFEQANNYGSLIRPKTNDIDYIKDRIEEQGTFENLFLHQTNQKIMRVLQQAEYLSPGYHLVVANPPYMGTGNMVDELKNLAKDQYPDSKNNLFAMFIERNLDLARSKGIVAMITMQSWMFISSFENLRKELLENGHILTMAHLGPHAFDSISGEVVSTTAFILANLPALKLKGTYIRLVDGKNELEKDNSLLEALQDPDCHWVYRVSGSGIKSISGYPIIYWISESILESYRKSDKVDIRAVKGLDTGGNINRFLRRWFEVDRSKISIFNVSSDYWYPIAKGGSFRKWYGNNEYLINYQDMGRQLKENRANLRNKDKYFREGLTWTVVSSGGFAVRFMPKGFLFDQGGSGIFTLPKDSYNLYEIITLLNSAIGSTVARMLCPTLNFTTGDVRKFLLIKNDKSITIGQRCIKLAKEDWDSFETSWDFSMSPLLSKTNNRECISNAYSNLRSNWHAITLEMSKLEEDNNRVFNKAYGLQNELASDVPLEEITLTRNPRYRYGSKKRKKGQETLLLADTMKEFISYSVGCMFGRYSLDKPGLILANQGDTADEYFKRVPKPTFAPDEDNVIPLLDEGWFPDDIAERFKDFLKITFGEEHYEENLTFLEEAIGQDVRSYFLKNFYKEHVKMYKKRPIYWLFSSPNGSFNVLIYMHRYQSDTISVILNDYLRAFREKLNAQKAHLQEIERSSSASSRDKTKALKDIDKLNGLLNEITEYEDKILYPLATQNIEIDLDDGVKVNYKKFSKALKHVSGLS